MKRIPSIDIARGLVMVIMALDHTRDYLHLWSRTNLPTDLEVTTPLLFFTRWITHFCAPSFVFLSGASAAIAISRSQDPRSARRFLLQRGLFLFLLELTVVSFAMSFDPQFRMLIFEVIGAIGAGFILLAFLSRLPAGLLLALALLILCGHGLLPPPPMAPGGSALKPGIFLETIGWSPGTFQLRPHLLFLIAYPVIPWFGIMLAGFAAGRLFQRPEPARRRLFLRMGLALLAVFVILRFIDGYGDPIRWTVQKTGIFTLMSFLNVDKYPPSLLFSLLTLGGLFLILSAAEGRDNPGTRTLLVYGRTPLFYFVVHLYLIHLILLIVVFAQGYHASELQFGPFQFGRPAVGGGLPTWCIYPIWIGVVITLYPLCRWYGRYKATHPEKTWLRYF